MRIPARAPPVGRQAQTRSERGHDVVDVAGDLAGKGGAETRGRRHLVWKLKMAVADGDHANTSTRCPTTRSSGAAAGTRRTWRRLRSAADLARLAEGRPPLCPPGCSTCKLAKE